MPDHAKEYSFDVIEFTMRANESCFDQFCCGLAFVVILLLKCSEILAHIELLYNPRVNKVFTSHHITI